MRWLMERHWKPCAAPFLHAPFGAVVTVFTFPRDARIAACKAQMANALRASWWTGDCSKNTGTLACALQVFVDGTELDSLDRDYRATWTRQCRIAAERLKRFFTRGLRVYNFDKPSPSPGGLHFSPSGTVAHEPAWQSLTESRFAEGFGSVVRWNSMFFAVLFPGNAGCSTSSSSPSKPNGGYNAVPLPTRSMREASKPAGKCLCGVMFHECTVGVCGSCNHMFCKRCLICHPKCKLQLRSASRSDT